MNLRPSLRLNNIVQSNGVYLVVTEIMASGITYDRYDGKGVVGHAEWGEVEAVPLTPEWLQWCGFVKDGKYFYCSKLGIGNIGWVRQGEYCLNGLPIGSRNMKFVHELQNLIFALTGTELKLTL